MNRQKEFQQRLASAMSTAPKNRRLRSVPGYTSSLDIQAQKLWQRRVPASKRREAVEVWWDSVPGQLQYAIDRVIRRYMNVGELAQASAEARSGPLTHIATVETGLWKGFQDQIPKLTRERFFEVFRNSADCRSNFADEYGKRVVGVLKRSLLVKPHAPRINFERDWQLAKWVYEERSPIPSPVHFREACKHWNDLHRDSPTMSVASVKTAVRRIQDEFYGDWYERRLFAYIANFPQVDGLTCPQCKGAGQMRNPDPRWRDWFSWRERNAAWLRQGEPPPPSDPEPQPKGDGSLECKNCSGTGRISPEVESNQ